MALTTVRPQGMGFVTGRRNLIINGAMQVAQRGTSFTGLSNGDNQYTLDRWKWAETASPPYTMSVEQSSTSPDGFSNSLKVTTTSGGTLASDDLCRVFQGIEAQNLQHLQYGSSGAQSLTLSFYVRSNVTGTYAVHFYQDDGGPRNITRTYTISAADTWEYKTLTIPGDTAGAIDDNNGRGLSIEFILLAGSDYKGTTSTTWGSVASARYATGQTVDINTTNDTWFLSGCQLEVGENASDFEHRSFDEEMRLCLRYFERFKRSYGDMGQSSSADATLWAGCSRSGNSGNNQGVMRYTRKRNNPSLSVSSATHINSIFPISPFNSTLSGFAISGNAGIDSAFINATNNASSAPGSDCASFVYIPNDSGYLDVDAEL